MSEPIEAEPTPPHDEEIDLRPATDRAKAADTIAGARTETEGSGPWSEPPRMAAQADARQSSSRLAEWTPDMDRRAAEQDTVIQEVPAEQTPIGRRASFPAVARVPQPMISQHREQCVHCGGSGFMPGINDYLRESIALLGDQGDEVVRTFYSTLFRIAPATAKLFPGNPAQADLGTDHRGAQQREKLLAALVALSDLYDPDDGDKMDRLDNALAAFGRSHAAFARPDGTVRGATWEEYAAVKDALFQTLVRAAGTAWKPEYTEAWSQAYDYAAAVMVAEQHRSGFTMPRFPRA